MPRRRNLPTLRCDVPAHQGLTDHLRLADAVINSTSEGVVVTDAKARILRVNRAFTEVTGYTLDEVRGQTPAVLRSGRHDAEFYAAMWRTLLSAGRWEGEIWNRRKNGKVYPELLRIEAVKDHAGTVTNFVGVFADLTRRKQSEERLLFLAHRDPLTGLANRTLFMERMAHAFERAQRAETCLAVVFIDLDGFKRINDTLGHDVGDGLLVEVARRLKARVRAADTLARLGGDEFVILLEDCGRADGPERVAQAALAALAPSFQLAGREVFVTASLGVAVAPQDGGDARTLLRHADAALYRAKEQGRNRYAFFSADLNDRAADRLNLENDLRRALVRDELVLHYQPLLRLSDGEITRAEALVRWNHPERGQLLPGVFIPLAEEAGLICELGDLVLRTACRDLRAWRENGRPDLTVAVNLSACQFRDPLLADRIRDILETAGVPGSALELEITETLLMHDFASAADALNALRALGVRISIDDFGTGFSSLNSLIRLPVDGLKIDRSFVHDLHGHARNAAVLSAIIAMARAMKLEVTAEGVEHDLQLAWLEAAGCDTAQGFLLSKPMGAAELAQLLGLKRGWLRTGSDTPN